MNYYNEIKNKLIDSEIYSKVKDYSKERHKVITYFEVGKLLDEAGSKYGDNILNDYSNRLVIEFGKKYNERTLRRIRQYYRIFKNEKWSPLATKLSWSHYSELLSIKDDNELIYYINIAYERNLSKRELREKIKNKEYQRMPIETKNKIVSKDKIEVKDLVPNPILIRNRNNTEIVTEKALHNLILEDIESFMKELGNSFSFIGSEYKIKIGDRNHYIDFLKVGHHGSDTSSSKYFTYFINPEYSIISVGKNNRYNHPKHSVLDNLSNSKIYRTDIFGSIKIKINKNGYRIKNYSP